MPSETVSDILSRLKGVRSTSDLKWAAQCPAHDDRTASLSVAEGEGGRALIHCHAGCMNLAVVKALGLTIRSLFPSGHSDAPKGRIVHTYDYVDANGELLYQVCRMEPKTFRQRRPDGKGGWNWNVSGVTRVLYRLPELLTAEWIISVEGEKDADNLAALSFAATCNSGGADQWAKTPDTSALDHKGLVIIADKDGPGRALALQVARAKHATASSVRILEMPGESHKDASDWISTQRLAGMDNAAIRDALLDLIDATPFWTPSTAPAPEVPPVVVADLPDKDEHGCWILTPQRTYPAALAYIADRHSNAARVTLIQWDDSFFEWRGNFWRRINDTTIGSRVIPWLTQCKRQNKEGEVMPFPANAAATEGIIKSLKWAAHCEKIDQPPTYLGDTPPFPVHELLPCKSRTVHIPTRTAVDPTPNLFVTNALDFDYDPKAPMPCRWVDYLGETFCDDEQQIKLLQEWFGYCLTADMSRQKAMMFIGPPRSGKGVISRILAALLGTQNVTTPDMQSMSDKYGFDALRDKLLAIITDSRGTMQESQSSMAKLLCLIGGDPVNIARKYKDASTMVRLTARVMLVSNEPPAFFDASTAMASRFVMIKTTKSHLGSEDLTLEDRLRGELPGILLWAIEGWERLQKQTYFTTPDATRAEMDEMVDASSPITAFVQEKCNIGENEECDADDVWKAWKKWSEEQGYRDAGVRTWLGRRLRAAFPGISRVRQAGGERTRYYRGIGLKGEMF
jgi:putative DNA primase/helicase